MPQKDTSQNDLSTQNQLKLDEVAETPHFDSLGLTDDVLRAVKELGYETPSPIQSKTIPVLLDRQDVIGQAQTGTGKTAAFALPFLSQIDAESKQTQLLVLTPTRELAIQVAQACQQYAKHLKKVSVLPVYGGQSYTIQIKQLKRGTQVIVGTPGRLMDLIKKKALSLKSLTSLVLDEADEMLRMGFIDDVKWIIEQSPKNRQVALFSATMPNAIKKIAEQYLPTAKYIKVASKTATADNIHQQFLIVNRNKKLDAIARILEFEDIDGCIVFVRTKSATVEVADQLTAQGFASEALSGDMPQANREKMVNRLRKGHVDILVATDVVARGLDVERISHVINYDAPHDCESYIHRIGRTGRAGRTGNAMLFITPREKRMLKEIERTTKHTLKPLSLPSVEDINKKRQDRLKQKVLNASKNKKLDFYAQIIREIEQETTLSPEQIAATCLLLQQNKQPLHYEEKSVSPTSEKNNQYNDSPRNNPRNNRSKKKTKPEPPTKAIKLKQHPEIEMQRFKIYVGWADQVKPGNIVGAIANEADLASQYIGHIEICDDFSTVDLPADMPKKTMATLKKTRVSGKPLLIENYKKQASKKPKNKK